MSYQIVRRAMTPAAIEADCSELLDLLYYSFDEAADKRAICDAATHIFRAKIAAFNGAPSSARRWMSRGFKALLESSPA